jgi:regulator of protease activity HflC (stomatin/prohibitin superfamily)
MLSPILLVALCVLALLVIASVRRVPEGHVYTFRRMDGQVRIVGSGMHLVLPLVERIAHKISLNGAVVRVEDLLRGNQRFQATVYFQVLDPRRADVVIGEVDGLLRVAVRRLFEHALLPDDDQARRRWLKQALNAELHERGLLVARVDLEATA